MMHLMHLVFMVWWYLRAVLTGVFQSHQINSAVQNGFIYTADFKVVVIQLGAAIATVVLAQ